MHDGRRDVVVTGMGAVTPFGVGACALWEGVRAGRSGVDWIEVIADLDPARYPVRYAAEVKRFRVEEHLQQHCEVRSERSVQMALVATCEAMHQAQLLDASDRLVDPTLPIATIVGTGHGPCLEAELGHATYFQRGPKAVRPTTIPKSMFNAVSSNMSIHFGAKGTNLAIASACSSGASAIGLATVLIRHGYADIVVAGGSDSPLAPVVFACWTSLRVLARHDEPRKACRPFDRDRNGMVLGEGAAVVVLESSDSAARRGAEPLAKVAGYGASSDAYHITAPNAAGQRSAIEQCLHDAHVAPQEVDYINAHGTGTQANDEAEAQAIAAVFGPCHSVPPVSSTKSMLGHSLGASSAIEFLVCLETLRDGFIPPTLNCDHPDPPLGLDYVPNQGRPHVVRRAMTNSCAFGGNNVVLLLEKIE